MNDPSTVVADNPEKQGLISRLVPVLVLTGICWLVFVINNLLLGGRLTSNGIVPRHVSSLAGILWSPFLHTGFTHLAANSLPLLILGAAICLRGRGEFFIVTLAGIVLGGGLTWLFARTADHVGASGLIFCYFGYLASLAFFRHNILTMALSIVCIVAYGGMLRGLLPTSAAVSWEGHVAGFIAGVVIAWLVAKVTKQPEPTDPLAKIGTPSIKS